MVVLKYVAPVNVGDVVSRVSTAVARLTNGDSVTTDNAANGITPTRIMIASISVLVIACGWMFNELVERQQAHDTDTRNDVEQNSRDTQELRRAVVTNQNAVALNQQSIEHLLARFENETTSLNEAIKNLTAEFRLIRNRNATPAEPGQGR